MQVKAQLLRNEFFSKHVVIGDVMDCQTKYNFYVLEYAITVTNKDCI